MINQKIKLTVLGIAIGSMSVTGFAADQLRIDQPDTVYQQDQDRRKIDQPVTAPQQDRLNQGDQLGRQLMTPEERAEIRGRMQAAQTVEERERIRTEQHALMQERSKAQGVTLPESPRMDRPSSGRGDMPGGGRGMGGGRGR